MRPRWIIPAVSALNLATDDGYRRGLHAGANLTTINLTPTGLRIRNGRAGYAQAREYLGRKRKFIHKFGISGIKRTELLCP